MVLVVALAVLVVALALLGYIAYSYWHGQHAYDNIAEEAGLSVSDEGGAGAFSIDWDALAAINPEVVGWIYIPGTNVNYPVAHKDGDSSYYLKHNFAQSSAGSFGAEYGCIFLAGENSADFSDQVNVLYGHNMSNGTMFASISKFYDSDTFNEHRTIYLLTPAGTYKLKSFAVDRVSGGDTTIVIPNFATEAELEAYVQQRLDDSVVVADPAASDASSIRKVFALSTCDGSNNSYRYITFCMVDEYVAADATAAQDVVGAEDAEAIADSSQERAAG